jgi:hypothetical protein
VIHFFVCWLGRAWIPKHYFWPITLVMSCNLGCEPKWGLGHNKW